MRKFHRERGQRKLFINNLAHNLIQRGRIETTITRAKAIRPVVERLVTVAKKQDVAALRRLFTTLPKMTAYKLYHDIAPRYQARRGGYLRIVQEAKTRKRDGTSMAIIEFVQ